MRAVTTTLTALAFASLLGLGGAMAAQGDTYKAKKAACQERAKTMDFGVHLIKKNRWVKDCVAGKYPA